MNRGARSWPGLPMCGGRISGMETMPVVLRAMALPAGSGALRRPGGDVTVVTMGPEKASETVRKALSAAVRRASMALV